MTDDRRPNESIDDMLRRATGEPVPSQDVVDRGMRRLQAAMREESAAGRNRRRRSVAWARAAVAFGLAVALLVVAAVVVPDEVSALVGLAEVAETVAPMVATEGTYVYRQSDQTSLSSVSGADIGLEHAGDVVYLRQQILRTWETADQIHEEIEVGPLVFFRPEEEAAFLASPLADVEGPGTVLVSDTERVPADLDAREWPLDPDELRAEMEAYISNQPADTPTSIRLMGLAANLLRDPRIDAPLRAAVLRVLDGIDGIEVSEADDVVTASVRYVAPSGSVAVFSMDFDPGARLVREHEVWIDGQPELGIPPGTVVFESRHSAPVLVDTVG